jgi:hypothetical protein
VGRPGLSNHRKFRRLARALGSDPIARGCLELLWESCYENGDDYLGDSNDVESAARWPGEPGVLTRALLEAGSDGNAGFIEQSPDRVGHYHVHHLFEHAPEYVQKRMAREIERKKRGQTISDIRRSAAFASHESRKSRQASANGGHLPAVAEHTAANGETPAQALAPAPAPRETTTPVLPDWMPLENWRGFAEMRQRMKAALTPRAIAIAIKKLDALRAQGNDPAEVLDQSVVNGWKGIFPVKSEEHWNGNHNGKGKPSLDEIVIREQQIARARAH